MKDNWPKFPLSTALPDNNDTLGSHNEWYWSDDITAPIIISKYKYKNKLSICGCVKIGDTLPVIVIAPVGFVDAGFVDAGGIVISWSLILMVDEITGWPIIS